MKRWLLLSGAIVAEVIGTLSLRAAVDHSVWIAVVVVAYVIAFALLGLWLVPLYGGVLSELCGGRVS